MFFSGLLCFHLFVDAVQHFGPLRLFCYTNKTDINIKLQYMSNLIINYLLNFIYNILNDLSDYSIIIKARTFPNIQTQSRQL